MRLSGLALTINASTTLPAAPWQVFEVLSDPRNRSAELRLLGANRPRNLLMLVDPPDGPRTFVLWEIASANGEHADPAASVVRLQAVVQPRGFRDRVRMVAGGARRLRDRANRALRELARAVGPDADQPRPTAASF